MAYAYPFDVTTPPGSESISQGDDRIREFKNAMLERITSFFTGQDVQPWIAKSGAGGTDVWVITSTGVAINRLAYTGAGARTIESYAGSGASGYRDITGGNTVWFYTYSGGVTFNAGISVAAGTSSFQAITSTTVSIAASSGSPLSSIGVGAFSRFSRNEAAFTGAVIQIDRSGTVAGYIGMDGSDNLTIQRGADAANALTINRTNGAFTIAGGVSTAGGLSVTAGGITVSSGTSALQALTATTIFGSGNVGVGVTPSNFATTSGFAKLNVGGNSSLMGSVPASSSNGFTMLLNGDLNAGATAYTYVITDFATRYYQFGGVHNWNTAVSGTAGTSITWVPQMSLSATGLVVNNGLSVGAGGITVSAGTTSLQALTATTGVFSGTISTSKQGQIFVAAGATTGARWFDIENSGGAFFFGVEQSTGGALITGSTGYATVLTTVGAGQVIQLGINQVVAATLSSAGLSITNALSAGGQVLQTGGGIVRIENTFSTLSGATGPGFEIGVNSGVPLVQAYNRTSLAYTALTIAATTVTFSQGGVVISTGGLTVSSGSTSLQAASVTTLIIGGGTTITQVLVGTTTVNPGVINAGNFYSTTVTVTGAQVGNAVFTSNPWMNDAFEACCANAYVSATNTVTFVIKNTSGTTITLTNRTLTAWVFR